MKISLNKKIVIVGLSMAVIYTVLFWASNKTVEQLTDDISLSNQLSKLTQITKVLKKSAEQYDENAPRDYESYNRDVKVYYQNLKDNINALSILVDEITTHYFNRSKITNAFLKSSIVSDNNVAFNYLSSNYKIFEKDFWNKIGNKKDEPRLEWANSYILEDNSHFIEISHKTSETFNILVNHQRKATQRLIQITGIGFILSLLILIVWFNQSILKRIIKVADGCRKVASGAFGYKITDNGSDEIFELVNDFNHLSSVTKSILSMVNKLQIVKSKQEANNIILHESQEIISGLSNLYMINNNDSIFTLQLVSPAYESDNLLGTSVAENDTSISWKKDKNLTSLQINDTLNHSVANKNSNLIKFLFHRKNVKSILIVYLKHNDKSGFLIFGKQVKSEFTEQELSILSGLNSLFSTALLAD